MWEQKLTEEGKVSNLDVVVDGVHKTGKVDGDNNEEGGDGSPVDTALVPVNPLVLVQHGDVEVGLAEEPVVVDLYVSGGFAERIRQSSP